MPPAIQERLALPEPIRNQPLRPHHHPNYLKKEVPADHPNQLQQEPPHHQQLQLSPRLPQTPPQMGRLPRKDLAVDPKEVKISQSRLLLTVQPDNLPFRLQLPVSDRGRKRSLKFPSLSCLLCCFISLSLWLQLMYHPDPWLFGENNPYSHLAMTSVKIDRKCFDALKHRQNLPVKVIKLACLRPCTYFPHHSGLLLYSTT